MPIARTADNPLRLAVLISGGGRTLENIAAAIDAGDLPASVVTVIASREGIFGIERAERLGFPATVVARKAFDDMNAFSAEVWSLIRSVDAELICLAGFLSKLTIPAEFENRVINVHPGLLPSFGGKGMYGHHVHDAVLKAGCKVSGCTVHFCDAEYDTGPIIVQRTCPVLEDDSPDTLAARVFEEECLAFPQAIQLIAEGRVRVEHGRTYIA